jgi:hypothetical protein
MANTKKVNDGLKSGIKTSEFYMALSAVVLGIIISTGAVDPVEGAGTWDKVVGVACSLLAALGYTVGRSNVKAAHEEGK